MVTLDQLAAMKDGDVFYLNGKRHLFRSFKHEAGFEPILAGVHKGYIWNYIAGYSTRYDVRIVPKEKTRKVTSRKQYAFSKSYTRPDGFKYETNDCTVRALMNACDTSYELAHDYLKQKGRKDKHGFCCNRAYREWTNGVSHLKEWLYGDMLAGKRLGVETMGQWIKSGLLPARCILITRNHAFAVVNDTVIDSFKIGSSSRVFGIFELIEDQSAVKAMIADGEY